jgi:hypothetical protein
LNWESLAVAASVNVWREGKSLMELTLGLVLEEELMEILEEAAGEALEDGLADPKPAGTRGTWVMNSLGMAGTEDAGVLVFLGKVPINSLGI